MDIAAAHAHNMADANARLLAAGRCAMHNSDLDLPPVGVVRLGIGNEIPVCEGCWVQYESPLLPADLRPVASWRLGP